MASEKMDTDSSKTPISIISAVKKAYNNRAEDIFKPRNAIEQASADSQANRIGNSRGHGSKIAVPNEYKSSKNTRPKYDPELMMSKRIIHSDTVSKTYLVDREARQQDYMIPKNIDEEDDETFFSNLKERIEADLNKKLVNKTPAHLPKRSQVAKKRKNLFSNDSLHLMKKFRNEVQGKTNVLEEMEHGVFSMQQRSQNQENIDVHQTMMEIKTKKSPRNPEKIEVHRVQTGSPNNVLFLGHKMSKNISLDKFEIDGNSLRGESPPLNELDATIYRESTPPLPSPSPLNKFLM